jgi:hypothetical protein
MRVPEEALNEFLEIYREEFGVDIPHDEACEMATRVLKLYTLLSKTPPSLRKSNGGATQPAEGHGGQVGFRT